MSGVPRASGVPDYGPAGTVNFDPELYSGKLVEKFYKTTVFGEIASTDYEGEIAGFGASVKIRTIPDVTVSDYVIGAGLTPQYPSNPSVTLSINQAKSFAVALSTVDARQSDLDLADVFANDGSIQLRIAADSDMLTTIPAEVSSQNSGTHAGADSGNINLGDSTTPVTLDKTTVLDFIVGCGQVMFGHSAGLTFASQIVECQMIDNPNDFGYIVRGLMVFGFQVIAATYIGTAVVRAG
jgi:hypothetical protein